jgi:hypothetical protein
MVTVYNCICTCDIKELLNYYTQTNKQHKEGWHTCWNLAKQEMKLARIPPWLHLSKNTQIYQLLSDLFSAFTVKSRHYYPIHYGFQKTPILLIHISRTLSKLSTGFIIVIWPCLILERKIQYLCTSSLICIPSFPGPSSSLLPSVVCLAPVNRHGRIDIKGSSKSRAGTPGRWSRTHIGFPCYHLRGPSS